MRISPSIIKRKSRRQSGSAVLLVLAVLAILMIFFAVDFGTLRTFRREMKLINQRQVRRLERFHARPNSGDPGKASDSRENSTKP